MEEINMAQIVFNGKAAEFASGDTLASFLRSRNIGEKNLILEWNGKILTENDPLESFTLRDGDTLNLFSMVGGG
jgi:thiamine biosynthesis protein ThiS